MNGVLKIHAEKFKTEDPEFVGKMHRQLYSDDFDAGVNSVAEEAELYHKVKDRYLEANFNFRKWRTNKGASRIHR